MKPVTLDPLPKLSDVPEGERTATVARVLSICHQQQEQLVKQVEQLALQEEQIQQLKDEIAILKGEKARPKIKPSTLNKDPREEGGTPWVSWPGKFFVRMGHCHVSLEHGALIQARTLGSPRASCRL